jgi:glycerophosphoryl diester phosphodiesterase
MTTQGEAALSAAVPGELPSTRPPGSPQPLRPARQILAVGHRGAPRLARENTLASLRAAIAAGADWIEVDVRLARCGTPVLLHDATLRRLWDLDRPVVALTAAELAGLPGPQGEGIPTLWEGLELARQAGVTVMVDLPDPDAAPQALAAVRELDVLGSVVFAGPREALRRVRFGSASARIALSWRSPLPPPGQLLAALRPAYLNVEHHWLSRPLVRRASRLGLGVSTWTVDRPLRMSRLAEMGVDVIISNDPATLAGLLRNG